MALPLLPGNFAMIFSIGIGPSGVWPVNLSEITSQPRVASCCRIRVRSFAIAGDPSGLGPSCTASFVYANASAPLKLFARAANARVSIVIDRRRGLLYMEPAFRVLEPARQEFHLVLTRRKQDSWYSTC